MKERIKHSSDCVLCFYPSQFHLVLLSFNTIAPALNKSFEPASAEFFWLLLKLLGCSSSKFFIVCERSALRCFWRASYKQKTDGSKSGLYRGCGTTSKLMVSIAAEVTLVWGLALSC